MVSLCIYNIPQSIASQAISTISYTRDYVRVVPLTIDATPLNYNTFLPDTRNNSLNSTVIHNENLNGTRNLTQQDIQTPSHFINEEIVQTTTTTQQSISPIRPNLTTPRNTNTSLAQVPYNQPLNLRLLQNIHKWIIKHIDP